MNIMNKACERWERESCISTNPEKKKIFWCERAISKYDGRKIVVVWGNDPTNALDFPSENVDIQKVEAASNKQAHDQSLALPWPSKRKWWRYYLEDSECPKRVLDYEGRKGTNIFDTVEAYTKEQAMAMPWKRKVKKTVQGYIHNTEDGGWGVDARMICNNPKSCTVTHEIEEEI